jgi:hypothetical protein
VARIVIGTGQHDNFVIQAQKLLGSAFAPRGTIPAAR